LANAEINKLANAEINKLANAEINKLTLILTLNILTALKDRVGLAPKGPGALHIIIII
jgi:hypothetical protein